MNVSVGAHGYSEIVVYAYNNSGDGVLSTGCLTDNVTVPNNAIMITDISVMYSVDEGDTLSIDANYTDLDSDIGVFDDNSSKWNVDSATGVVSWVTSDGDDGVYYWYVNVSDGYGSIDQHNVTVTVNDTQGLEKIPPNPTNLQNTTGNFWVNYTWEAGTLGNGTDSFNVSVNDSWNNNTVDAFMNVSVGPNGWANITVYAYNESGTGMLSTGSISDSVQAVFILPPNITSFDPDSPVNDICGAARTFSITINQTVNVTWFINGTEVQTDDNSVAEANYTNTSAAVGHWNVSAVAKNTNGTEMQTWCWTVGEGTLDHINVTPVSAILNIDEYREFNATGKNKNGCNISSVVFAWHTNPPGVGTLKTTTGADANFTAVHAGRAEIYAVNGSVSSNASYKVVVTVNAETSSGSVTIGSGNATSGNSTVIVNLENESVSGTINITEIGDPVNDTTVDGIGLGTNVELIKGVNITSTNITNALTKDTNSTSWVYIKIEYNESQLGDIDEDTLFIYKFVSGTGWVKLVRGNPQYCLAAGRNTTANYVYVNVTECSIFGLGGRPHTTNNAGGPHTPSSGGGGGGGGVSSNEPFANIEKYETREQYLYADREATYSFTTPDLGVYMISVTPAENAGSVSARVDLLKDTSTIVDLAPDGVVYKNVNIWLGTSGFATSENIRDAVIRFKVSRDWPSAHGVDSIVLMQYTGGNWVELKTVKIGESDGDILYESSTDHFSCFAIVGKAKEMPVVVPDKPTDEVPSEVVQPTPEPTEEEGKSPGFGALYTLIGILATVFLFRRRL